MLLCGALVGLTYFLATVFVLVFFVTSHPTMDATPVEAARGFRDAGHMVAIGTWLTVLPLPFALLFLGDLASVLRRSGGGPLAVAAIVSGVATFLITSFGALVSAVTPAIGTYDTSAAAGAVVKALDGVMPMSVALSGFPRAVLLVTAIVVLARVGLAGRGLVRSAYVLAILSVLGTGALMVASFFPFAALSALLFTAWVAVLSLSCAGPPAGDHHLNDLGRVDAVTGPVLR